MSESVHTSARLAFVLIDGVGDVNTPSMGNLTPLQAAHTPCLSAVSGEQHSSSKAVLCLIVVDACCKVSKVTALGLQAVVQTDRCGPEWIAGSCGAWPSMRK